VSVDAVRELEPEESADRHHLPHRGRATIAAPVMIGSRNADGRTEARDLQQLDRVLPREGPKEHAERLDVVEERLNPLEVVDEIPVDH